MQVIKLTSEHVEAVRPLFYKNLYMGISAETKTFVDDDRTFSDFFHEAFVETYLSGLTSYHAYGCYDGDQLKSYIGFYESSDDASWYWTQVRNSGSPCHIKAVLDKIMHYNESNGRLKFYSMFPSKYIKCYRRLAFSNEAAVRYDYFDEFIVNSKHACKFTLPWHVLYTRTLAPVDTLVRCTFLKQEYRELLYNAGRL